MTDLHELRRNIRAALDARLQRANELQGGSEARARSDPEGALLYAQLMAAHDTSTARLSEALLAVDTSLRAACT